MPLNWGILGAGNISGQFAHDLLLSNGNHIIRSVGSSLPEKAERFIEKNDISAVRNSNVTPVGQGYTAFYSNPEIDVIYIGTPHTFHKEQVLLALRHDKHVLCEKPFTVTGADAREIFDFAATKYKLVMEAVWTRFFPAVEEAKRHIFSEKTLGEVHRLTADFSRNADIYTIPESSRARDINLGAGATLDGIYPLTYARVLLDEKVGREALKFEVKSFLSLDPIDGVDHLSTILVRYEDGKQAVATSSNYVDGPLPYLRLEGTKGTLEMYGENPAQAKHLRVVFRDGRPPVEFKDESDYIGFIYEANAVAEAISAGKREADLMPWTETLLMMDTMDKVRWENGLHYPGEGRF